MLFLLASASPCIEAKRKSAIDGHMCLGLLAEHTDHEMTVQWQKTLAQLRREDIQIRSEKLKLPTMAVNLLASQRAWLRYRDAQCGMVSDQFAGGTGYGDVDSRCRIQLNRQRVSDLKHRADRNLMPPFP